jgi:hypothetical protein
MTLSRRGFLLGSAGVAGLAVTGCSSSSSPRPPHQEAAIFDLSLETAHRFRPFELVAPGFEVTLPANSGPPAPYAAVELRLTGPEGSASAGLTTDDDQHVLVRWSGQRSLVSLEVRRSGRTRVLRRRTFRPEGAFGLAFAVCENQVTALVDTGDGWTPLLTERTRVAELVDLRDQEVLSRHTYTATGDALDSARAGLFGMTGVRDPHLVQHADGTPYTREGRHYLTWTCAGLGFFQQAHWTIWSFDPAAPQEMRPESQLFSRRDGLVLGDHAGQVVRDGDRWIVATSSWGDFAPGSIHVRHTTTTDDVLSGVHVLDTEPAALPTSVGSWDPAITRLDDTWHVAFVESPSQDPFDFHPALATTDAEDWADGLKAVFAADSLHQCEGPIIATVQDHTWLLASDGDNRVYPIFDLTGRRVGRLDAPYPTNIPHPQLVPDPAGGWWMVTFDGTQYAEDVMGYGGHGDVVILHST